jgi:hypothetical protein
MLRGGLPVGCTPVAPHALMLCLLPDQHDAATRSDRRGREGGRAAERADRGPAGVCRARRHLSRPRRWGGQGPHPARRVARHRRGGEADCRCVADLAHGRPDPDRRAGGCRDGAGLAARHAGRPHRSHRRPGRSPRGRSRRGVCRVRSRLAPVESASSRLDRGRAGRLHAVRPDDRPGRHPQHADERHLRRRRPAGWAQPRNGRLGRRCRRHRDRRTQGRTGNGERDGPRGDAPGPARGRRAG